MGSHSRIPTRIGGKLAHDRALPLCNRAARRSVLPVRGHRHVTRVLVLMIAVASAALCALAQADSPPDPFPLSEGTYWVYQGLVRYDKPASKSGGEKKVNWRMEIVRVFHRDDAVAAIVKGFPDDLNWSTGDATPAEAMIVRTNDGKVYRINSARTGETEKKLRDSRLAVHDLFGPDDLWFQLPLAGGGKACGEDRANRDDGMYCWTVEPPVQVPLAGIKGVTAKSAPAFLLSYRTNPDSTEMEFVPGVGILHYEYHHHGTLADTELQLIEFHCPN